MTRGRVDLPVDVLAAVAERERLGALHITLQPEPLWLPDEEQEAARARVDGALAEAGLLGRGGKVEPEFLDWLPLLTSASLEYYGWFTDQDVTWGVVAAARGLEGVLAVRKGTWVALLPVPYNRLAEAMTEQLPEVVPGGGKPWTVRVADFHEAAQRGTADRSRNPSLREVVKVVQRQVTGSGELYVAERDELGRYSRLEQPLHYVDTDWGRYLNYTTGTGDDAEIHVAPATPAVLAETLQKLRTSLAS